MLERPTRSTFFLNNLFQLNYFRPFPHSCTVPPDAIRVFYLPTDAQNSCFKIYTKTTPTCFGLITIIKERIV